MTNSKTVYGVSVALLELGAAALALLALLTMVACGGSAKEPASSPTPPPGMFSTLPTIEPPIMGDQPPTIELNTPVPTPTLHPTPTPDPTYTPLPTLTPDPTATPVPDPRVRRTQPPRHIRQRHHIPNPRPRHTRPPRHTRQRHRIPTPRLLHTLPTPRTRQRYPDRLPNT